MPPSLVCALLCALAAAPCACAAADQAQWGERFTRNMVSPETGLPQSFDPATGENVLWTCPLGTKTYAVPIVANGRVFIGTNNGRPRDPRHQGDRSILLCLNEGDGSLQWQLVIPKVEGDNYQDWPSVGICSPVTVEGDRAYLMTSRGEVLCLDTDGLADGNDGPFMDEGRLMAPEGAQPLAPQPPDADVLWRFDMLADAGCHRHDSAHASILIRGRHLYMNTCNGVDNTHKVIRRPDAPALVVLDKETGRLIARDTEGFGPRTVHGTWSSPSLGAINGKPRLFFGGPDGVCYAFEPMPEDSAPRDAPLPLKRIWRFDCDPDAPKETTPHQYMGNREVSPSLISGMPVFLDGRVFVASGGDIWWGKHEARLQCIDGSGEGDITRSGLVWTAPLNRHCVTTPAIHGGLVFIADSGDTLHCLDAQTGQSIWTHDTGGETYASAVVADGKVYTGTRRGDFWTLAASREKKVLGHVKLDSAYSGMAIANGTLFIASMRTLYAAREGARSAAMKPEPSAK